MTESRSVRPAIFFCLMGYRGAERVAEALLTRADVDLLTLEPTTALLTRRGIPNESLYAYSPADTVAKANAEAVRRIEDVAVAMRTGALRARYPFLGDELLRETETALLASLRRDLVAELVAIESLENAAQRRDLRLLVVSEDHGRDMRTLVHYAHHLGIPSLQVLHGVPVGRSVPMFPAAADYHAVYSGHLREVFTEHGVPEDRVFVTGNPAWDRLAGPVPESATRRVYAEMALDPARPVITYAITAAPHWCHAEYPYPDHAENNARAVLEAYIALAARHPGWQFLLRPRASREDAAPYEAMVSALEPDLRERIRIDRLAPYHSIAISDVLLCTQSNMGIEAILMGKPVINVDLEEYGAAMYRTGMGPAFDEGDAVIHVAQCEDIAPAIERALLEPATRAALHAQRGRSIRRFNERNDGRASERVADCIIRLLATGGALVPPGPAPWGQERLAKRRLALELNREGEEWFAEGDYLKASRCFLKAVKEDRACAEAFNNLAVIFLAMQRPEEAWTYAIEALHLEPYLDTARENLRDVAAVTGRESEAARILELFGRG